MKSDGMGMMAKKSWDAIWIKATLATAEAGSGHGSGHGYGHGYGLITDAAIAVKDGRIAWLGAMKDLPADPEKAAAQVYDVQGACITPGLIDCHTHVVFASDRAAEFELRLKGATYEEIAHAGGGIRSTVRATRSASEDELFVASRRRVRAMMASGTSTVEIKSGYGLDADTELKMLRVAKRLGEELPLTVRRTYLGAHSVPAEFQGRPDDYVEFVCREMIPKVAQLGLADAVDVFCENIAFSLAQTEKIFAMAQAHGLAIKCHAEQLSDSGAAALAARYEALSVDHLEYLSEPAIKDMARSGTVAVLLPGSFYYLREKKLPPIASLRAHKIPVAIATDCNPGTSPMVSLPLAMNMGCTLFGLTPEEAFAGVTKHAAQALGMAQERGTLATGKQADLAVWDFKHPSSLAYFIGYAPLRQLVKGGRVVDLS